MIREYGADIGGPIVKDKLWLWFAGSYQTISTNHDRVQHELRHLRLPRDANLEPFSAKLNWQISNANSPRSTTSAATAPSSTRAPRPTRPRRRRR